jgi:BirA family biotin operon repressor/biotin-[acetyl-CoA-carboxylase] ligase
VSDLSTEALQAALAQRGAPGDRQILFHAITGSTNDDARAEAARGAPHGAIVVADAQTAGRGRGGHGWHSPAGENLYLSLVVRPRVPAASIPPLTLAIGVAVARVAAAHVAPGVPVWIKWPNDVLAGPRTASGLPRKLAGVLVEGQLRGAEMAALIVGVGLNVHARAFPEELAERATSLALAGGEGLDRAAIAADLVLGLESAVAGFEVARLASFLPDLARLDALRGLRLRAGAIAGEGAGIDADGCLLLRTDRGALAPVATGEVLLA